MSTLPKPKREKCYERPWYFQEGSTAVTPDPESRDLLVKIKKSSADQEV